MKHTWTKVPEMEFTASSSRSPSSCPCSVKKIPSTVHEVQTLSYYISGRNFMKNSVGRGVSINESAIINEVEVS